MAKLNFAPRVETADDSTPLFPNAITGLVMSEAEFMEQVKTAFASNPDRAFAFALIPLAEDNEIVQVTRKEKGGEGEYLQKVILGATHNDKRGSKFSLENQELLATMPADYPDARLANQYLTIRASVEAAAASAPTEETVSNVSSASATV